MLKYVFNFRDMVTGIMVEIYGLCGGKERWEASSVAIWQI
jgi:hypothetical protein